VIADICDLVDLGLITQKRGDGLLVEVRNKLVGPDTKVENPEPEQDPEIKRLIDELDRLIAQIPKEDNDS
jgi:hypothetical protein